MNETSTDSTPTSVTYTYPDCTCPGCDGTGHQKNNDGITIECPLCGGTGRWQKKPCPQPWYEPTCPPYNPWSDHPTYQKWIVTC